jgi:hypothetical protein
MLIGGGQTYVEIDATNTLKVASTTASTSTTTGALQVAGGIGVAQDINAGGKVAIGASLAIGPNTASGVHGDTVNIAIRTYADPAKIYFQSASGASTFGDWDSTRLSIALNTASTSSTSGALVVAGGVGIGGGLNVGGAGNVAGSLSTQGNFVVSKASPDIWLVAPDTSQLRLVGWHSGGTPRWALVLADNNATRDFAIEPYNDGGASIGQKFIIRRADGKVELGANLVLVPDASATPASNGQLTFQATSNTSLTFKYKGTDGTVRSANLTLA